MKVTAVALVTSAIALAPACGRGSAGGDGPLKVAAAASLSQAFEEIGRLYTAETGREVVLTFASSGKIATQITEGAPYDVFASADESYIDEVIAAGAALADSKTIYAYGRVVAWTADDTDPPKSLADVADPRFAKIALANPDHAPYGLAAREALQRAGAWERLEGRVVYGTNVGQALQYGTTGNADVAFTALSLVIGGPGHYLLVADGDHAPLGQAIVVVKGTGKEPAARAFVDLLRSPEGRAILAKYGLLQKGESLPAP